MSSTNLLDISHIVTNTIFRNYKMLCYFNNINIPNYNFKISIGSLYFKPIITKDYYSESCIVMYCNKFRLFYLSPFS